MPPDTPCILTINTGSSSLKAALYRMDRGEQRLLAATVDRIGRAGSRLRIAGDSGSSLFDRRIDLAAARGRILIAHLGNGASMAAVRGGVGIDTTMGFTPTGGLVMGTRPGDLDPSIPLYLIESQHLRPEEVGTLFNAQSGLLGVSETSPDMHDLLAAEAT